MNEQLPLTMEQQCSIAIFNDRIKNLSREDLLKMCDSLHREILHQKNQHLELLKKNWGID